MSLISGDVSSCFLFIDTMKLEIFSHTKKICIIHFEIWSTCLFAHMREYLAILTFHFDFWLKKSIAEQIIAAIRQLNSFGVGKYFLGGAKNRSNATQNLQETKNCDHDRWREIRKSNDIGEDRTEFRALSAGFHCYGHTEGLTLWIA